MLAVHTSLKMIREINSIENIYNLKIPFCFCFCFPENLKTLLYFVPQPPSLKQTADYKCKETNRKKADHDLAGLTVQVVTACMGDAAIHARKHEV